MVWKALSCAPSSIIALLAMAAISLSFFPPSTDSTASRIAWAVILPTSLSKDISLELLMLFKEANSNQRSSHWTLDLASSRPQTETGMLLLPTNPTFFDFVSERACDTVEANAVASCTGRKFSIQVIQAYGTCEGYAVAVMPP